MCKRESKAYIKVKHTNIEKSYVFAARYTFSLRKAHYHYYQNSLKGDVGTDLRILEQLFE